MREAILRVLIDNGLAQPGELHSWRCSHPDRYGTCTCMEDLADDLVAALSPKPSGSERAD